MIKVKHADFDRMEMDVKERAAHEAEMGAIWEYLKDQGQDVTFSGLVALLKDCVDKNRRIASASDLLKYVREPQKKDAKDVTIDLKELVSRRNVYENGLPVETNKEK